jgi:hypothetical protein
MVEVALKEHVEALIDGVDKRLCARITQLELRLREQHDADEKAVRLKAADMEKNTDDTKTELKRLADALSDKVGRPEWNDYHQRTLKADYLPRGEFASEMSRLSREREAEKAAMRIEREREIGESQGKTKVLALIYSVISLGIAMVGIVAGFIFHR